MRGRGEAPRRAARAPVGSFYGLATCVATLVLCAVPACAAGGLTKLEGLLMLPLLLPLDLLRLHTGGGAAPASQTLPLPPSPPAAILSRPPPGASVLALGSDGGWWAFALADGARLAGGLDGGVRRVPRGKRAWAAAALRDGPGGVAYMPTFYGDPFSAQNHRGLVQAFNATGPGPLRRFDRPRAGFELRRPADFLWVDLALPCGALPQDGSGAACGGGGAGAVAAPPRVRRQLVVAAAGNDALPSYDAGSGELLGLLGRGDNTTASTQGPVGLALDRNGTVLYVVTQGSWSENEGLTFPGHLRPALLALPLAAGGGGGHPRLLASLPPDDMGRFTSVALVPAVALSKGGGGNTSAPAKGGGPEALVTLDDTGRLRWYDPATGELLRTVDAAAAALDPRTGAKLKLELTQMRAFGGHVYVAASEAAGKRRAIVLRFGAGGAPAGRLGEGGSSARTAVWIGPLADVRRAYGLAIL